MVLDYGVLPKLIAVRQRHWVVVTGAHAALRWVRPRLNVTMVLLTMLCHVYTMARTSAPQLFSYEDCPASCTGTAAWVMSNLFQGKPAPPLHKVRLHRVAPSRCCRAIDPYDTCRCAKGSLS